MIINLNQKLIPVDFGCLKLLESFYSKLLEPPADLNATMMIAWREALRLQILVRRGILFVIADWEGVPVLWGPPIGDGVSEEDCRYAFDFIGDIASRPTRPAIFYAWENYQLWPVLQAHLDYHIAFQRNEYVYSVAELSNLDSLRLRKKRQERSRFERRFSPKVSLYDPSFADGCVDLLDRWIANRRLRVPAETLAKFDMESAVCRKALRDGLQLQGVIAQVADHVEAFSLGVPHSSGSFNCLFEKANYQLPGSAAFIFSELARCVGPTFEQINAGGDWAIPYLAQAKLSWRPSRVTQAYSITLARD